MFLISLRGTPFFLHFLTPVKVCSKVLDYYPMKINLQRIRKALKNPRKIGAYLLYTFSFLFPDKLYLALQYRAHFGRKINWGSPQTYNEKIQWLKLYDRNPEYVKMVDKYAVKQYVSELIGTEHVIPLLGAWNSPDEINFGSLPEQFVLKCTHDSGKVIICKDKKKLDINLTKKELKKALKRNYYRLSREWPYKNVPRKIIAEEYMVDESGYELKDYKFFCFDGVPEFCFIACDREVPNEETKFNFYDMDFNLLPFTNGHPNSTKPLKKPLGFEQMKSLAAKMSNGIPHVRIDFYDINGKIYFGEYTFYHWSGFVPFDPETWDYKLGELIHLP